MAEEQLPQWRVIGGHKYVLRMLQVLERGEDGAVRTVRVMRDEDRVQVSDGMEFFTAYVFEKGLEERSS